MKRPTTKELLEHPYLNQAPSFRQFSTPRAPFSSAMKAPPTQVKNMVSQINDLTPGRRQKLSKVNAVQFKACFNSIPIFLTVSGGFIAQ